MTTSTSTRSRTRRRGFLGVAVVGLAVASSAGVAGASSGSSEPAGTDATMTTDATADSGGAAASIPTPSCDEGADRPLFYVLYKEGTQQYFIEQAQGATDTAAALCADIQVVNVEQSGDKAITEMQNAIAAGADGIGITVPDQQIGPQVAQLAADAGIPVIATDDIISDADGNPVPFAGFNGTDMGTKVGQMAAQLLTDSGWVADGENVGMLSVEKQDLSVCVERTDAEKAIVASDGGLADDHIFPVAGDGTIDGALTASSPVITAHPDVTHWVDRRLQRREREGRHPGAARRRHPGRQHHRCRPRRLRGVQGLAGR